MLYVVATPIGNLNDVSIRTLEVLRSVSVIACEDTRVTRKLLAKYEISAKCVRCDAYHEEKSFVTSLLPMLQRGEDVALVSDSGTPGISDSGTLVVERAYKLNIDVCPIPGASAASAVMSIAGICGKGFHFEGFLQRKSSARKNRLIELMTRNEAFIIYESPYRIVKFLEEIADIDKIREMLIAREMTKKFETIVRGSAEIILEGFHTGKYKAKGEFTVLVYPCKKR